ncbi:hypothetical protein ES703_19524 [subsurface metagenome]
MPTPLQIRDKTITDLFELFKDKKTATVTDVHNKIIELFPTITQARAEDYARTVLRMMKTEKPQS